MSSVVAVYYTSSIPLVLCLGTLTGDGLDQRLQGGWARLGCLYPSTFTAQSQRGPAAERTDLGQVRSGLLLGRSLGP